MCAAVPSNSTIGSRTAGLASCRKVLRTARILEEPGYLAALTADFQTDKDKSHLPKSIRMLLEQSTRRRWRHLAEERLNSVKPTIPGKAVLDTKARGTHGLKPDVRKRLGQADAHFTWGSSEGRSHRAAGCRLLDEGMQFAWAASLRRDTADRSRKGFEPVPSRRQGRVTAAAPRASKVEIARDNGRASAFSKPRTADDGGEASRKIRRCSRAYAAGPEGRGQSIKPYGSDEFGALSSGRCRARARSPNDVQPTT
jgi:hypothetical protein